MRKTTEASKKVQFKVRLSPETIDWARQAAAMNGLSLNAQIVRMIESKQLISDIRSIVRDELRAVTGKVLP